MEGCSNGIYLNQTFTPLDSEEDHYGTSDPDLQAIGYDFAFREWLRSARNFRGFKLRATRELEKIGLTDWAYARLDVPVQVGIEDLVGTANKKQIEAFSDVDYHNYDLTMQHAKNSKSTIFRSSIESFFKNCPIDIDVIKNHNEVLELCKSFGFYDQFSIPLFSRGKENHAIFSCSTLGLNPEPFSRIVEKNTKKLGVIVLAIESVGIEKYPEMFIGRKIDFEKTLCSRSMRLLSDMAIHDYKISEAAEANAISRTAADKQLAKIREFLGVRTTHGAVMEAVRKGYISTA